MTIRLPSSLGITCGVRTLQLFLGLLLCQQAALRGDVVTIDFESLTDLESVTNQFSGLTFTNTTALLSGAVAGSLNEFEFPPKSDFSVVSDYGGPITITFTTPVLSFAGYFTYLAPLTLTAFDASNTQVGQVFSLFSNNLACLAGPPCSGGGGSGPNELLQVAFAGVITSVIISGDQFGGSFTLDDITYEPSAVVPEPSSLLFVLTALGILIGFRGRCQRNR